MVFGTYEVLAEEDTCVRLVVGYHRMDSSRGAAR